MNRSIRSSGREPWIFRAESPADLLVGAHPGLMAGALSHGGELDYLLYSPIWDVAETPFGLVPEDGSHALAVTPWASVISRDPHDGSAPSLECIEVAHLASITLGQATLTGWLTLRQQSPSGSSERTIAFHATAGGHHFTALVRALRNRMRPPESAPMPAGRSPGAPDHGSDASLSAACGALLLPSETVELRVATQETWDEQPPGRCRTRRGLLAITGRGVLLAEHAPMRAPHPLAAAVGTTCWRHGALETVVPFEQHLGGAVISSMRLELAGGWQLEVATGASQRDALLRALLRIPSGRGGT